MSSAKYQPHNQTYWERKNVSCKNPTCQITKGLSPKQITEKGISHTGYGYCSKCYGELKKAGKLPTPAQNKKISLHLEERQEYESHVERYRRALNQVMNLLQDFLQDMNLLNKIYFSSNRIKSFESIKQKQLKRKKLYKNPYVDMEDIAGLRIVCIEHQDVEAIHASIKNLFKKNVINDKFIKVKSSGYEAIHITIQAQPIIWGISIPTQVEIQLRTLAQDYFANMSQKYNYKIPKQYLPKNWEKTLRTLSKRMNGINNEITKIGDKWRQHCIKSGGLGVIDTGVISKLCKKHFKMEISDDEAFTAYRILHAHKLATITGKDLNKLLSCKATKQLMQDFLNSSKINLGDKFALTAVCSKYGKEYTNLFLESHKDKYL